MGEERADNASLYFVHSRSCRADGGDSCVIGWSISVPCKEVAAKHHVRLPRLEAHHRQGLLTTTRDLTFETVRERKVLVRRRRPLR